MISFADFVQYYGKNPINIAHKELNTIIQRYTFLFIEQELSPDEYNYCNTNIKESKLILIDYYQNDANPKESYFIISFQNTIIVIQPSLISLLQKLFPNNLKFNICFLQNAKNHFTDLNFKINYKDIETSEFFNLCIIEFNKKMSLLNKSQSINQTWLIIRPSISGYLIKSCYCYDENKINRIKDYYSDQCHFTPQEFKNESEFIFLQVIDFGSFFKTNLYYSIKMKKLVVIKVANNSQVQQLIQREFNNYSEIKHPLIPKLYGTFGKEKHLVIELIEGNDLTKISSLQYEEKIKIIFELMLILEPIHRHHFVYRDLKPNNIMIDKDKNAILIDFDSMICMDDIVDNRMNTNDFDSIYMPKEIGNGFVCYESDIYSLGKVIEFILAIKEENPANHDNLVNLCKRLTAEDIMKRPSIIDLILDFYIDYHSFIHIDELNKLFNIDEILTDNKFWEVDYLDSLQYEGKLLTKNVSKAVQFFILSADLNDRDHLFKIGLIYYLGLSVNTDMKKSIHYFKLSAEKQHPNALLNLGIIYFESSPPDIEKAMHYWKLSADFNFPPAQYYLSEIFLEDKKYLDVNKGLDFLKQSVASNFPPAEAKYGEILLESNLVEHDIQKGIHYLTLSADHGFTLSYIKLGGIYQQGRYVKKDINKAINCYIKASEEHIPIALFKLGIIYFDGDNNVPKDINKAIKYLTEAANLNYPEALFNLGVIYFEGNNVSRDISKGLHYLNLASEQNSIKAQFNLGLYYFKGIHVQRDINKAIYYYTLAANQNDENSQFNLALIYFTGRFITTDINKAINYFSLAANNHNNPRAQYNLGIIYYEGMNGIRNVNEGIKYLMLAAKQNHPDAIYNIGIIYYEGNYVKRDIGKAIHYLTLAADYFNDARAQYNIGMIYFIGRDVPRNTDKGINYFLRSAKNNFHYAQFKIGHIYYDGIWVQKDVSKAMHYFELAANQNDPYALIDLGFIYEEGKFVNRDIKKSIKYYKLASDQNFPEAQYNLGMIYLEGKYVKRDVRKALHYLYLAAIRNFNMATNVLALLFLNGQFVPLNYKKGMYYLSLSAKHNNANAQYFLGNFYYYGILTEKNIDKGLGLLIKASENGEKRAYFSVGFIYHESKKNYDEAIHYYKEASSLNNQFAKNNLGVIYWINSFGDFKFLSLSVEYFKEAIKQENDLLSMFNLASLYLYNDSFKDNSNLSIELLIKSALRGFIPSRELLCLALIKKFGFELATIMNEIDKLGINSNGIKNHIYNMIVKEELMNQIIFREKWHNCQGVSFLYNALTNIIPTSSLNNSNSSQNPKLKNISRDFYDGLGILELVQKI